MKLLIASDVHGSAYYCKKLKEFYLQSGADKLLLLGDLLYHGARNALPKDYSTIECTEVFNSLKEDVICVRGNCDSEVDQMVLAFPILAEYCVFPVGKRLLYATHGHKKIACLKKGDILLNGHFHVPTIEERENCTYVNCGSTSIPKEGSPHSCLMLEGETLTWYDLDSFAPFRTEKL